VVRSALRPPNGRAQLECITWLSYGFGHYEQGRKGIPFDKLARISYEFQQFLALLGEDLQIPRGTGWLATSFYDGSFACTAEKIDPVEERKARAFKQALETSPKGSPTPASSRPRFGSTPESPTRWTLAKL